MPLALIALVSPVSAQTLDEDLQRVPPAELAALAKTEGDAARGAVLFFQQHMACSKCHAVENAPLKSLGPDLTAIGKEVSDEALVDSVLLPSKVIRKGFESATVVTADGKSLSVLLVERTKDRIVVRDISRGYEPTTIATSEIEEIKANAKSIMPAGQVNQLNSRQQFLDLIRYLIEIRDGGAVKAMQLQPAASLLTFTVAEYEQHLDHAALIADWNADSLQRGESIYQRVCANCHGTKDSPGSLPTSLRFAEGKFKNGSDPLSMYRTLTHGFGLMAPQTWMVPSQKYDVIHYIRETYLKPHNPSQFVTVDQALLSRLPKGDTCGPEPSKIVPWSAMDYGPSLTHTYEVPGLEHNLAYKGVAVRLDPGAGGVSRGRHWMIFDTDTLRAAAAWNGSGKPDDNFIDWQGIQFNGAHGVHPRVVGRTAFVNSTGPGWANPGSGEFLDNLRVQGRDGRRYGPLPRDWAKFRGLYHHDQQVVFSYSVGTTDVLESPRQLTAFGAFTGNPVGDVHTRRVLAGHYRGPRWRANGRSGVGVGETHAALGEGVEMRCFVERAAIATQIAPAEIVDQKEHEVRRRRSACIRLRRFCVHFDAGLAKTAPTAPSTGHCWRSSIWLATVASGICFIKACTICSQSSSTSRQISEGIQR